MGLKKRIKRKIKHVKKVVKYANPKTAYKSAVANIKKTTGKGKDDSYDDAAEMADARSLAAQKVIKDQQRQAGGGQVSFSAETYA